jgi:hypothetical protein
MNFIASFRLPWFGSLLDLGLIGFGKAGLDSFSDPFCEKDGGDSLVSMSGNVLAENFQRDAVFVNAGEPYFIAIFAAGIPVCLV